MAFREASAEDGAELAALINSGYSGERQGEPEGFRTEPLMDAATVALMVADPECHWLLAEAPNGRGTVSDGTTLGCCCYSVGKAAASKVEREDVEKAAATNGEKVGAIRLLTVLPAFRGLLVGRRLLERVERTLARKDHACSKVLCCVPELRVSMLEWAGQRGYTPTSTAEPPPDMKRTFSRPTSLVVVAKPLAANESVPEESVPAPRAQDAVGTQQGPSGSPWSATQACEMGTRPCDPRSSTYRDASAVD